MKIELPQKFSQNDPRWKNATLGTKGTIGAFGCLMTDATMTADYYGENETPLTLNEKLKNNGGYVNGNLFNWEVFAKLYGLKYSGQTQTPDELTTAQMNQIKAAIDKGYPVFLQIDTVPATSGLDEHWVLATDYDGDDFIVQDPWDGVQKRITSWGVKPQKLIWAYCWYEGKVPNQAQQDPTMEIKKSERDFLVGRSTTAKEVAQYLEITNPDQAPTQEYKNVIGGIKSTATASTNSLNKEIEEHKKTQSELSNRVEQVSRLKEEVTQGQVRENSLTDQLKKATTGSAEIVKVYQGQLQEKQNQIVTLAKDKGQAQNDAAGWKAKYETLEKSHKNDAAKSLTLMDVIQVLIRKIIPFLNNTKLS